MSDLGSWGNNSGSAAPQDSAPVSRTTTEETPWPVSQLAQKLKGYIEKLGLVWVEGEITKVSFTNNMFASLRDLTVESSVEIFAWNLEKIDKTIQHGDRVIALVKPNFWPKNGKLNMQVFEMRKVGLGELLERIERLRAQLAAEGLTQKKQPLPFLPNCVGLVTGRDSDAEKDVLQNARLRWPEVKFKVQHSMVQGDKAAGQLVAAIKALDADPEVDVIIVARGGGSFLDLLVFSDEQVVRAAAATTKPLVSAIGHENDRPVLDDVADLRASTPQMPPSAWCQTLWKNAVKSPNCCSARRCRFRTGYAAASSLSHRCAAVQSWPTHMPSSNCEPVKFKPPVTESQTPLETSWPLKTAPCSTCCSRFARSRRKKPSTAVTPWSAPRTAPFWRMQHRWPREPRSRSGWRREILPPPRTKSETPTIYSS